MNNYLNEDVFEKTFRLITEAIHIYNGRDEIKLPEDQKKELFKHIAMGYGGKNIKSGKVQEKLKSTMEFKPSKERKDFYDKLSKNSDDLINKSTEYLKDHGIKHVLNYDINREPGVYFDGSINTDSGNEYYLKYNKD